MFRMPATKAASVSSLLKIGVSDHARCTTQVCRRQLILGKGEFCSGLYVVEAGSVGIFKSSNGGREQVLSIDGPGTSIAERAVFDGGNYPASAQRSLPPLYSSSASRTSHRYALNSLKSGSSCCNSLEDVCQGLWRLLRSFRSLRFVTDFPLCWFGSPKQKVRASAEFTLQ